MQVLDALHRLRERLGRSLHPGRSAIRVLELIDALTPAQRAKVLHAMLADTAVFPPPANVCLTIMRNLQASQRAAILDALLSDPISVATPHGPIRFIAHSRRGCLRGQKILKKEPDSLRWIDGMAPDSVFWDIGANVGVLTLYAATRSDLDVWAFEPSAVNFFNLAANCELNGVSGKVRCLLLGFGDETGLGELKASQFSGADSFSFIQTKKRKIYPAVQTAPLWTIDEFVTHYDARCPNYIKIDVPGYTRRILRGASRTLARPEVSQLQIEAKEHGTTGRWIAEFLAEFGFTLSGRNMKRGGTVQGDLVFAR